jgi:hypothetical protein
MNDEAIFKNSKLYINKIIYNYLIIILKYINVIYIMNVFAISDVNMMKIRHI